MADQEINLVIRDAQKSRVFSAINRMMDKPLTLSVKNGYETVRYEFEMEIQGSGEANVDFVERVIRTMGGSLVKLDDLEQDFVRYKDEMETISQPSTTVDGGIE